MSVATAIIETSTDKEKEMENKLERYHFTGFTFGHENWYNLTVRINNHAGVGTSYIGEMSLELTETERQELVKLLINAKDAE
jgi:hypothetical protein